MKKILSSLFENEVIDIAIWKEMEQDSGFS